MSSLGAANKTIDILKNGRNIKKIWRHGQKLIKGINLASKNNGLEENIFLFGLPCSPYLTTNINNKNSFKLKTLLQEELIKNNILMPWISISSSHGDKEANYVIKVFNKILPKIRRIIENDINKYNFKNIIKPVFRRFN